MLNKTSLARSLGNLIAYVVVANGKGNWATAGGCQSVLLILDCYSTILLVSISLSEELAILLVFSEIVSPLCQEVVGIKKRWKIKF